MYFAIGKRLIGNKGEALLAIFLTLILQGMASTYVNASVGNGTKIEFSGRLFETSACRLNGGKSIEVDFGRMNVTQIDGVNFAVIKVLPFECDPNGAASVRVLISAAASVRHNVVKTNKENLGIAFYDILNGNDIPLNQFIDIDLGFGHLALRMTPVKEKSTSPLRDGGFLANVIIITQYN